MSAFLWPFCVLCRNPYLTPHVPLKLPAGTTAGDVLNQLLAENPSLVQWRDLTRFGVNLQFVEATANLQDGDELVLIPPVSGG